MPRVKKPKMPNGYILWQGPSPVDGRMLVCLLVKSKNRKTGPSWQTWILVDDMYPNNALRDGSDRSVCGDCPHRWRTVIINGKEKRIRTCYVIPPSISTIWRAYKKGLYPWFPWPRDPEDGNDAKVAEIFRDAILLRLGAYGDPAMLPVLVNLLLLHNYHKARKIQGVENAKWVGYTHQWQQPWFNPHYLGLLMYSCDTPEQVAKAHALGARVFYTGKTPVPGLSLCPASKEYKEKTGKAITCGDCGMCNGQRKTKVNSFYIPPHGSSKHFVGLPVIN